MPVGTSGGVTVAGFAAALAGAAFIGAVGFVLVQAAARVTTGVWLLQRLGHHTGGGHQWVSWLGLR